MTAAGKIGMAAGLAVACLLAAGLGAEAANLRPATADEILQTLQGRAIAHTQRPMPRIVVFVGVADTFCPGGVYFGDLDGKAEQGTWTTRDGEVCSTTPSRGERCSRVFKDAENHTFVGGDEKGKGAESPLFVPPDVGGAPCPAA